MTHLHGLVTIYELFAGFNLINTGAVNCLIMSECTQTAPSEAKNPKIRLSGTHPPQTPAPRRLDTRAFGARPGPPNKSPGSASKRRLPYPVNPVAQLELL